MPSHLNHKWGMGNRDTQHIQKGNVNLAFCWESFCLGTMRLKGYGVPTMAKETQSGQQEWCPRARGSTTYSVCRK